MYASWRNLARRRVNEDKQSAAQALGFVERRLTPHELCSWRQDWQKRSIHPLATRSESIEERRESSRVA